jgi:hypothetical protein
MVAALWVSSLVAVVSVDGLECAEHEGLVPLCLFGAALAAIVGGLAFGVRERLGTFPEIWGLPVAFEFVAYRVLLTVLVMLALVTAMTVASALTLPTDCPRVTTAALIPA